MSLTGTGTANASSSRSATSCAVAMSASSRSTANSSPPSRAAVSPCLIVSLMRSAMRSQQLVADGVAQAVVDVLEVVEVEEHHDERLGGTAPALAWASRSAKSCRLASPVSVSWNAW